MMVLGKNSSDPDENTKIVTITNSILLILHNNGVITSSEYEELTLSPLDGLIILKGKLDPKKFLPKKDPSLKKAPESKTKIDPNPNHNRNGEEE
jgi:hypothetical protein